MIESFAFGVLVGAVMTVFTLAILLANRRSLPVNHQPPTEVE